MDEIDHFSTYDITVHQHGKTSHFHAGGSMPHGHMLRAICQRIECQLAACPTHDIHPAPHDRINMPDDDPDNGIKMNDDAKPLMHYVGKWLIGPAILAFAALVIFTVMYVVARSCIELIFG